MKVIDIEGLDGCGKRTQSSRLNTRLNSMGYVSQYVDFPSNHIIGKECEAFQCGKYGNPLEVDPYLSSMLYATDRLEVITGNEKFYDHIKSCDYLICDRYKMSNLICHLHKFDDDNSRREFIANMAKVESSIPQEDITIFLRLPTRLSMKLITDRVKNKNDLCESIESQTIFEKNADWIFLHQEFIEDVLSPKKNYKISFIDCYDEDDNILSPNVIHTKILSEIIQI